MQDSELIAALRGTDAAKIREALDRLFPGASAMLLVQTRDSNVSASTGKVDPSRLFVHLLQTSQQVGGMLGLQLAWTHDPNKVEEPKIEIVPEGAFQ